MSQLTYILTTEEHNSHGQSGSITHTFRASSLAFLNDYIDLWEDGYEDQIPEGQYTFEENLPEDYYEAGGFTGRNLTFTCQETGEDMKIWWETQGWGTLKG